MERRGVVVQNGIVLNTIVWGNETDAQLADDGYDHYEETTDMVVQPGPGWSWSKKDGYRPPSPYDSWSWNGAAWEPPTPRPTDGGNYEWDETKLSWNQIPETSQTGE